MQAFRLGFFASGLSPDAFRRATQQTGLIRYESFLSFLTAIASLIFCSFV